MDEAPTVPDADIPLAPIQQESQESETEE
jgi:hypothetical protein